MFNQLFHIGALILVTGLGLFIMISGDYGLPWVLWGMWFYFSLALLALALEVLAFAQGSRSSQGA